MINLDKVSSGMHIPKEINVIIEISANSHPIKYELNKETGLLQVDRFLSTAMNYPCNYGFIPETLAEDGDPVDVMILTQFPLIPKAIISARPIGVLLMSDEAGVDAKILATPISKVDPYYDNINNYFDLPQSLLDKITHFFSHYKDLEKGKVVSIEGWDNAKKAEEIIKAAVKHFNRKD